MKLFCTITFLVTIAHIPTTLSERQALFVKKDVVENGKRVTRQTSADQMVQNILQWLQGVYTQNSRRIRQGTLREYLPPINTQKPRPFEPIAHVTQPHDNFGEGDNENNIINEGYPPVGSITPRPPFTDGYPSIQPEISPPEFTGYPTPSQPVASSSPSTSGYPTSGYPGTGPTGYPNTGYPTNGYPSGPSTAYPSTGYPKPSSTSQPNTGFPSSTTGYPIHSSTNGQPDYSNPSTGFPSSTAGYPSYPAPTTNFPSSTSTYPDYPTPNPSFPSSTVGYPSSSSAGTYYPSSHTNPTNTGYPTSSTGFPSFNTDHPSTTGYPSAIDSTTKRPTYPSYTTDTQAPLTVPHFHITTLSPIPEENTIPSEGPHSPTPGDHTSVDSEQTTVFSIPDDDLKHPPHIHSIDVECSKDMMTINIEFNREFNGIIYSKGHYNTPECRYVKENSGQTKYTFTVSLNSCGTEFVNAFDTQGKSYLENVLVLQNEPGIQEVWDTIRSVRCLWEGSLKKVLNVALSVGMLNQEIVTFSGDTAMARLDIQLGKGPFAPSASGLVKIGEIMTLVVSVSGDPGFDIQVKDCRAKDSSGENVVALTDDRGCVLKPKLFGSFQKTRNTGNTGASIIAYAFFSAFKFPDVMDLTLECNVDLCKTDCEMCPDPNQKIEPGRRRKRDLNMINSTRDDSVRIGKMLKVILPEDLNDGKTISFNQNEGVCMSTQGFVFSSAILMSLLTSSCLFSAYTWLKYYHLNLKK